MSSSPGEILKGLVGLLDENFQTAEIFQPRHVRLTEFTYVNDEEIDKAEELLGENTVQLSDPVPAEGAIRDLTPSSPPVPVVAVDAASVRLGETDQGIVSAVRVAVVSQGPPGLAIERFGPYLAHVTEQNKKVFTDFFESEVFRLPRSYPTPGLVKMTDRLRNYIERLAQRHATSGLEQGIVLWDGAIRETVDTPVHLVRESIGMAHGKGSSVVGISKKTTIRLETGEQVLGLLEREARSCWIDIDGLLTPSLKGHFLGLVHVVKFTEDGFPFRVDVAPVSGDTCSVLERLKASVGFYNGYPEPLRQAHINAYFTPDEILSLQTLAIDKYRMEVLPSFDIRRHILAPF